MPTLDIDSTNNLVTNGTLTIRFGRRYEATLLALLINRRANSQPSAVTFAAVSAALALAGQKTVLSRKQMQRLLESLEAGLAQLLTSPADAQVMTLPRKRTTGPWWWPPSGMGDDDTSTLPCAPAPLSKQPIDPLLTHHIDKHFQLVSNHSFSDTRKLILQYFYADAAAWDGRFIDEVEVLAESAIWQVATPAAKIHRHMRLARAHDVLRQYREANEQLQAATKLARKHKELEIFFVAAIEQARIRIRYNQHPTLAIKSVIEAATGEITKAFARGEGGRDGAGGAPSDGDIGARTHSVNPIMLGRIYSLRGLAHRRSIEALPDEADVTHRNQLIQQCLSDSVAAICCLLATFDLDTTQSMVCNMAYCLQKIAERGWLAGSAESEVVEWYRLAFAWHNRFHLADNTVWEYIYLGEFWLSIVTQAETNKLPAAAAIALAKPNRTPDQTTTDGYTKCQGKHPSELDFYTHAFKQAQQIDDARQIAHSALNLYRFSKLHQLSTQATRAKNALRHVAKFSPDVISILKAESADRLADVFAGLGV